MSCVKTVRVRSGDAAAQRRAKSIRDDANAAGGQLGDPPALEKSALFAWMTRPPPRPRGQIPIHDTTDGAAVLRRVLAEPMKRPLAEPMKDDAGACGGGATPEKFSETPFYERNRKRRWRAARKAAGLPTGDAEGQRARRARRKAAREAPSSATTPG
jgi:hypothetical protein